MGRSAVGLAVLTLVVLCPVRDTQACMGDLNDDGTVRVDELVEIVSCAMDDEADSCPQPPIVVDELVLAVNNALHGCTGETAWMGIVGCRQCEACPLFGVLDLVRTLTEGVPDELLPDGVVVLDSQIEIVQAACAACGCPEPGSPIYRALVARADVEAMTAAGWSPEP